MNENLVPHYTLNDPLAKHTTFRIGGPAQVVYLAQSSDEVQTAAEHATRDGIPWRVIGEGSNILANDTRYEGAIIAFKNARFPSLEPDGEIMVSGGTSLSKLIYFTIGCGFEGLENLAGIPGTVGGAIVGNAGAYGSTISVGLKTVRLMAPDGTTSIVNASELEFDYRDSRLKRTGEVVLNAKFKLPVGDKHKLKTAADTARAKRVEKHPNYFQVPTAVSFLKNLPPPDGETRRIAAGKLLDEVDARTMHVGQAGLWYKHANIVVNLGRATSRDVKDLTREMAWRVKEKFGVDLEPEVTFL
jgi:UDP-N-acetylmuramate dehydrogenase